MNPQDIENLAKLARMELGEAEKASLAKDMQNILAFVDQIKEAPVDTNAEGRLGPAYNVLRPDENPHEGGIHTEALLANAPDSKDGFVKVKKIL